MFARFHRGIVVAVATLLLGACAAGGVPVRNVTESPVVTNKANPSMDDVRQAIVRAGTGLTWQMRTDRPGHILGTLALRTHVAVVDIEYNQKSYNIKYKDSTNLEYNGSTIHRNYNGWIDNLDRAIKAQLSAI
jgi:type IV pilus biogenesis protein CpaD/CtpE